MIILNREIIKLSKNAIKGIDPTIGKKLIEQKNLSAEAFKQTEEIKKDSKLISDHFME